MESDLARIGMDCSASPCFALRCLRLALELNEANSLYFGYLLPYFLEHAPRSRKRERELNANMHVCSVASLQQASGGKCSLVSNQLV